MQVKTMRGDEVTHHCDYVTHLEVKNITAEDPADTPKTLNPKNPLMTRPTVALEFELVRQPPSSLPRPPRELQRLRLPDDGEVLYIMNDKGDTTDTYRWPLRPVEELAGAGA